MSLHVLKTDGSGPACDPPLAVRATAKSVHFTDRSAVTCPNCLKHLAFGRAMVQGKIHTKPPEPEAPPLAVVIPEDEVPEEDDGKIIKFPGAR